MNEQSTPLKITRLLKFALYTFRASFIIGSVLLIILLSDPHKFGVIIYIAIAYTEFALIFNVLLLLILLVMALKHRQYSKQIILKAALLLCNIPIAIAYIYFALFILSRKNPF